MASAASPARLRGAFVADQCDADDGEEHSHAKDNNSIHLKISN